MKISEIEKLIRLFDDSTLARMEYVENDVTLKLEKTIPEAPVVYQTAPTLPTEPVIPAVPPAASPAPLTEEASAAALEGHWITSPLVGTFYQSNVEGGDALVHVGDKVSKGDLLCIIEAMKMMNEIRSDVDGVVKAINVTNGEMVEYDKQLILIGDAQ